MNNVKPLFDSATYYRIEVRGRIDVEWLKRFDGLVETILDGARQIEDITVLNVYTDQSGIIGLVRRLHGLGITILQLEIIQKDG